MKMILAPTPFLIYEIYNLQRLNLFLYLCVCVEVIVEKHIISHDKSTNDQTGF